MNRFLGKLTKNPFVINLLLMAIVSCAIVYGVLKWIDSYTRHNQAVIVPDIKNLSVDEAAIFIHNSGLRYTVIDSVFSKDVAPGAIVELRPHPGSKVKEGRILFITINATTAQMGEIPEVEDVSLRQAYALLKSRGFNEIETEYVPGEYENLVICVESNGRPLGVGEKIKLTAPLVLKVSSGEAEADSLGTTMDMPAPVESLDSDVVRWF